MATRAALVSRVSRLRRSRARASLSLNLKKKRDCSQSIQKVKADATIFVWFQKNVLILIAILIQKLKVRNVCNSQVIRRHLQ